jgi:hypothetical protein
VAICDELSAVNKVLWQTQRVMQLRAIGPPILSSVRFAKEVTWSFVTSEQSSVTNPACCAVSSDRSPHLSGVRLTKKV